MVDPLSDPLLTREMTLYQGEKNAGNQGGKEGEFITFTEMDLRVFG